MANVNMLGGHKEWTSRKIDPRYSMTWMRNRVSSALASGGEEDMSYDKWPSAAKKELLADVRKEILNADLSRGTGNGVQITDWANENIPDHFGHRVGQLLGYAVADGRLLRSELRAVRAALSEHDTAVTDQLSGVYELVEQHADGTLDADAAVRKIAELLTEATS